MEGELSQVPCLIFSSSEEGLLLSINKIACEHLGYKEEELVGKKADIIFTLPTRIFQQTHLFPLLELQGKAEELYLSLLTKTNEYLPLLVNVFMRQNEDKAVRTYAGIVVQNRKKFEDELVAAKKAAETALNENTLLLQTKKQLQDHAELLDEKIFLVNKQNDELRQFSRVVTHDLQEPLRKMLVFTNMMLGNDDEQTHKKAVERIKNISEQMRSTLSGVQQFVWLNEAEVKKERIDLNKLLLQIKQQLEKEHTEINLLLTAEKLPEVEGDHEQLLFLFQEVFSNAIRFRKVMNEVLIQVASNNLSLNKYKNVAGKYDYGDFVRIQISDEGVGFDEQYKDQVFELFKRFHPQAGRGLGLSLCKKIVESHYGRISINSIKNKGTTVTILLPSPMPDVTDIKSADQFIKQTNENDSEE